MTDGHFGELLPCSAMQILHTGAREALGNEFYDVTTVTTRQPAARLGTPLPRHGQVGVRAKYLECADHGTNRYLKVNFGDAAIVEPIILPLNCGIVDKNVTNESQQQVRRQRSLALLSPDTGKAQY
ncbi:hypothetical protein THAOC_00343 [Thalassiosira oceanica]|uniref:Uncharacterized protein n=1 Tax=Thalassiosira oceanica TaxID=159749 RepID=K0TPC0_THAOC|nr:hypothetical protein THAOC_00343 [Thalassiosira oceanica]|eukprot:EJK77801.1 hypothetical protein THAOC_00343 [Thalassiosira oceanica]